MKKLILLVLVSLTIFSCGDEVEFNTPAFQGDRTNLLWRAQAFSASIDANGFLTITGTNNVETVNLRVPSVTEGTFIVGDVNTIEAEYIDAFNTRFSTNNRPDEDVSIYPELGEIVIDEIDLLNRTFTGTFRFLAFNASGLNSIGYTNGIFFRVPLIFGDFPANPVTCTDVDASAEIARLAYEATFAPDVVFIDPVQYSAACSAYIDALNVKRSYCGDVDGAIQDIIDGLADCQISCAQATLNSVEAQSQYNAATIGNYLALCAQYQFYLEQQILFCGDEDGSIQAQIDALDCGDADGDGVPNVFENFNGDLDGNLDDDDTDADGIPNYLDADDDGDGVPTADEAVDADGNPVDTDGDGDVDYLDNDDDGDGLFSNFETGDTDGDGIDDYLDADDDNDTLPTINENADPNADGNPVDALDTDLDGVPDYLQA